MTEEAKINGKVFNEVDPNDESEAVLRTLIDFELVDEKGNLLSLDEIGDGKNTARCIGKIIEPLDDSWRHAMFTYAASSENKESVESMVDDCVQLYKKGKTEASFGAGVPPAPGAAPIVKAPGGPLANEKKTTLSYMWPAKGVPTAVPPFDRSSIKTGDSLDGYCIKTFKWYSAKVIKMRTEKSGSKSVLIHFQGWQSRYDEWIDQMSDRLVAEGTSSILMREQAQHLKDMVPWFESEKLVAKVNEIAGTHRERKTVDVVIDCIEDWAIDLTYINPTLWLVSHSGIWYRVAGPLCPGGIYGQPTERYAPLFKPTARKFVVCSHVAMVLIDFFPFMPKITTDIVCSEVNDRTRTCSPEGRIRESDVLSNHVFVIEQISSLSHPPEWTDKKLPQFENSAFIHQLKKSGPSYVAAAKKLALAYQSSGQSFNNPPRPSMGGMDGSLGDGEYGADEDYLDPALAAMRKKRKSSGSGPKDPESDALRLLIGGAESKASGNKYPMEDKEFWEMERKRQMEKDPSLTSWSPPGPPMPEGGDVTRQMPYAPAVTGVLLSAWSTFLNFRYLLNLPHISLEEFEAMLQSNTVVHPLLKEVHVAMLAKVLADRGRQPLKILVDTEKELDDQYNNVYLNALCALEFEHIMPKRHVVPGMTLEDSSRMMPSDEKLRDFLRTGDCWIEVLRVLIAEFQRSVLREYHDPLGECLFLINTLMQHSDAAHFCLAVDPVRDNVPDYHFIVKEPMDLSTIQHRLHSGWYDYKVPESMEECTAIISGDKSVSSKPAPKILTPGADIQLKEGDIRDVFCTAVGRWCVATVLSVDKSARKVTVRFIHKDEHHDQVVDYDQPYIAGKHTMTRYLIATRDQCVGGMAKRAKKPSDYRHSSAKDNMKIDPDSTKHTGPDGVLQDVRRIYSNAMAYYKDEKHNLCAAAGRLIDMFEEVYTRRVSDVIERRASARAANKSLLEGAGSDTKEQDALWQAVIETLGCATDYASAPLTAKIHALSFAFDELCSSVAGRKFLDESVEITRFLEAEGRATRRVIRKGATGTPGEDIAADAMVEEELLQEDDEGEEKPVKKLPAGMDPAAVGTVGMSVIEFISRKGYKRMNLSDGHAGPAELSNLTPERMEMMKRRLVRTAPLGRGDREDRNYWVFTTESPDIENGDIPRIFVEDVKNGRWLVYSSTVEINALHQWLDHRTKREGKTKEALYEWMLLHGVEVYARPGAKDRTDGEEDMDTSMNLDTAAVGTDASGSAERRISKATSKKTEGAAQDGVVEMIVENEVKEMGESNDEGHDALEAQVRAQRQARREQLMTEQWRDISKGVDINHRLEFWVPTESQPIAFIKRVALSHNASALGMACRELQNSSSGFTIILTGFNPVNNHSPVQAAGIRIGDRICAIGNFVTRNVLDIRDSMKEIVETLKKTKGEIELDFLILRYPDPFAELSEKELKDPVYVAAVKEFDESMAKVSGGFEFIKESDEQEGPRRKKGRRCVSNVNIFSAANLKPVGPAPLGGISDPHPLLDQMVDGYTLPSHIAGHIILLLQSCTHPYASKPEWAAEADAWIIKLTEAMCAMRDEMSGNLTAAGRSARASKSASVSGSGDREARISAARVKLVRSMSSALLRLDGSLNSVATKGVWVDNQSRMRFKWRKCCADATTLGQVSICVSMLANVLRTELCKLESRSWEKKLAREIIAENQYFARHACLHEGATVLYYGDGHAEAEALEKTMRAPRMWGASGLPFKGHVMECKVTAVRLFKCGTKLEPLKKCYPFAQIDLQVLPPSVQAEGGFKLPIVAAPVHPKSALNRLIGHIVFDISELPEANSLYSGPHKSLMPEYAREVGIREQDLLFLKEIRTKVRNRQYTSTKQLFNDVELCIRTQKVYYKDRNPDIMLHCDSVQQELAALFKLHEECFEELTRKESTLDPDADKVIARKVSEFTIISEEVTRASDAAIARNISGEVGATHRDKKRRADEAFAKDTKESDQAKDEAKPGEGPPQGTVKTGIPLEKVRAMLYSIRLRQNFLLLTTLNRFPCNRIIRNRTQSRQ